MVKMHWWERKQLGHYCCGLSFDDKGTGGLLDQSGFSQESRSTLSIRNKDLL